MSQRIHEGRNVKRFREMMGLKQDALAWELGNDWNQQRISMLEQKETIEVAILQRVSDVLKVPVEAFQNFDAEQPLNIISNTINNSDNANSNALYNFYPTFNPIEKWLEVIDENKKLYERLLISEQEKTALLKEAMDKMK